MSWAAVTVTADGASANRNLFSLGLDARRWLCGPRRLWGRVPRPVWLLGPRIIQNDLLISRPLTFLHLQMPFVQTRSLSKQGHSHSF